MQKITIASTSNHFSQENMVFGQSLIFEFEWMESIKAWVLHVLDQNQNPLKLGIKMLPSWPLFKSSNVVIYLTPTGLEQALQRHNLQDDFVLIAAELED